MSWQCASWALREAPCPTATSRLVLIALADRCQPDGRSAWPTIDTLMLEAHCSEASVRRALRDLEKAGAIRRGNQSLAQWNEHGEYIAKPYRSIVWECCMGVTLEKVALKPGRQARQARTERKEIHGTVKMTGLKNVGDKPIHDTDERTGPHGPGPDSPVIGDDTALSSVTDPYMNKYINKYPSLPTGDLPARGKDSASGTRNGIIGGRETARSVVDRLTLVRSGLSLPTPEPSGRDLAKASGLIAHIANAAGVDETVAAARVADIIDWIPTNTYWLARILTVRDLARVWDRLANDYAVSRIELRRSPDTSTHTHDGQAHATAPSGPHVTRHVHSVTCPHVLADMKPHESEYSHEGSLRHGKPSEWYTACRRHADELNRREGFGTT